MSRRSFWPAAALGLALLAASTTQASAESAIWTLVASPLTATTGSQVTYTLTATNTDPLASLLSSNEIGCVSLDVPGNFVVHGAAVTGASTGTSWSATVSGNRVRVSTGSGGDRLATLDWVRFTLTATATSTGQLAWSARAFRDQGCGGSGALLAVPPIVVVTGPALTPTPLPTQASSPSPGVSASPSATPSPTPVPAATPRLTAVASPSEGAPRPSDPVTPRPDPSAPTPPPDGSEGASTDAAQPSDQAGARPGSHGGGAERPVPPDSDTPLRALDGSGRQPSDVDLAMGPLGLLGGIDIWLVPGAIFAVPGIGVILFVLLQGAGALAWMPAIRRLRGDEPARAG